MLRRRWQQQGATLWQSGVGRTWLPDSARLTTATTSDVRAQHGDDGVAVFAYLRAHPDVLAPATESPLVRTARLLDESLLAYRQGRRQAAQEIRPSLPTWMALKG